MDEAQLDALAGLTLVPLDERCTADGHAYQELTVHDADGSSATYRDTGCAHLRVEGAAAMLSAGALDGELFMTSESDCP
jgi:hypothetical protein